LALEGRQSFLRAKARARKRSITLRSLIEESLASTLDKPLPKEKVIPVTFGGKGLSRDYEDASWEKIRDAIYHQEVVVGRPGL
jgi:hypothetical protein